MQPPFSRQGTSEAAANSMRGRVAALRTRIVDLATQRGLIGITCDEAERLLGLSHQTCSARFNDLESTAMTRRIQVLRMTVPKQLFVIDEAIADYEFVRSTRSGRQALVYFAFAAVTIDDVLRRYGLQRKRLLT